MEISFEAERLAPAARALASSASTSHAAPTALRHVLLHRESDDGWVGTVNDGDHVLSLPLDLNGAAEGPSRFTVEAKRLADVCRLLRGKRVSAKVGETRVSLAAEGARYVLQGVPSDAFPVGDPESARKGTALTLPASTLAAVIEQVSYAGATHDVRHYLNGVHLQLSTDRIVATASDGHRFARTQAECDLSGPDEGIGVILPRTALPVLSQILEYDNTIRLAVSDNCVVAAAGGAEAILRLVDGRFPDINRVVPEPTTARATLTVDRGRLQEALNGCALVYRGTRAAGLRLSVEQGRLHLLASNPDEEHAENEIEVTVDGDFEVMGVNGNYLMDAVQHAAGEQLLLRQFGVDSLLSVSDPADPAWLAGIMPMRL